MPICDNIPASAPTCMTGHLIIAPKLQMLEPPLSSQQIIHRLLWLPRLTQPLIPPVSVDKQLLMDLAQHARCV